MKYCKRCGDDYMSCDGVLCWKCHQDKEVRYVLLCVSPILILLAVYIFYGVTEISIPLGELGDELAEIKNDCKQLEIFIDNNIERWKSNSVMREAKNLYEWRCDK